MSKPTLFIGSSNKGLDVARALGSNLDDEADILIWSDHIFAANQYSLDSLLRSLDTIDYAILIITLDDLISQRSGSATTPRDNLLRFTPASLSQEVGLALGAQAGERRLRDVLSKGGFTRVRRAAETPFNMILEARP
jgi:predicted nucleotide-binding protein